MRRIVSLLAALALVAGLAGSSVAASGAKSSFVGDFDLLTFDQSTEDWTLLGHASAQLFEPTDQRLVPGRYDFKGAAGNPIRESHAQIGRVDFWFDDFNRPPTNVALGEGVECVYYGPNVADCHPWAVMFVDNLDPAAADEVAFAISKLTNGDWDFQYWQVVGKGDFVLKYYPED
jgi:hypothetical protein